MLYMVEMDMPHAERLPAWHDWYAHHLERLVAIPGILTAQRFGAGAPTPSPYLAVYTIANAEVMTSPAYRAKAGPSSTGDWQPLMTNWFRNIVEGVDALPEIPQRGWLALADRVDDSAPPLPEGFTALRSVGLDRSFTERGLMIGSEARTPPAPREEAGWRLRVFTPLSPQVKARGGGPT